MLGKLNAAARPRFSGSGLRRLRVRQISGAQNGIYLFEFFSAVPAAPADDAGKGGDDAQEYREQRLPEEREEQDQDEG